MKKKIILIGYGGHYNSVVDVINMENKFNISKVLDNKKKDENLNNFLSKNKIKKNIHISFASIYNLRLRSKVYFRLKKKKLYKFPVIISPLSYVSNLTKINQGSIVMHGAIINSNTVIDENVVVNSNALVEHDVLIGDNSHISTGVIINGGVKIGKNCFVGSGSIIKENIIIPDNTFIKMGSVIKKNFANSKL